MIGAASSVEREVPGGKGKRGRSRVGCRGWSPGLGEGSALDGGRDLSLQSPLYFSDHIRSDIMVVGVEEGCLEGHSACRLPSSSPP